MHHPQANFRKHKTCKHVFSTYIIHIHTKIFALDRYVLQSQLDFHKKSNSGSEKRVPATDKSDKNFRNTYRKYFHEN